jgi:hypothetical protein
MIDPILSLAFSVQSNKGVYALLLGSGISKAAEIPTGWEITRDLIRKLAILKKQDCEPDPFEWFKTTFGEDPDYSNILDALAKSPTERQQMLRSYFEPSDEEREQGLKKPTAAHKAIAQLVRGGYVRVILTTNFDRLLEQSLEEVGVIPTAISTTDAIAGALPLIHSQCSVVKVNGDYLDIRIRNTAAELATYDPGLNDLLDRIFDEFGLIVCGWSAEWDIALRSAIQRCSTRRFSWHWVSRSKLGGEAQNLVSARAATVLACAGADEFFIELHEKVLSLEELSQPHPLSSKVAAAAIKRYIVDQHHRIRLHDLIMGETEKLISAILEQKFDNHSKADGEVYRRVRFYESATEVLRALMITGCYWGNESQQLVWIKCLERVRNFFGRAGGYTHLANLQSYPALVLLYSGGIASIAAKSYDTLFALLMKARYREKNEVIVLDLDTMSVIDQQWGGTLPGMNDRCSPTSDHLHKQLRNSFLELAPDDQSYDMLFDQYEYLFALMALDLRLQSSSMTHRAPFGRFGWRARNMDPNVVTLIDEEVKFSTKNWLPLKAGFLGGSLERYIAASNKLQELWRSLNWH